MAKTKGLDFLLALCSFRCQQGIQFRTGGGGRGRRKRRRAGGGWTDCGYCLAVGKARGAFNSQPPQQWSPRLPLQHLPQGIVLRTSSTLLVGASPIPPPPLCSLLPDIFTQDFGEPFMNISLKPFLLLMADNYTFQEAANLTALLWEEKASCVAEWLIGLLAGILWKAGQRQGWQSPSVLEAGSAPGDTRAHLPRGYRPQTFGQLKEEDFMGVAWNRNVPAAACTFRSFPKSCRRASSKPLLDSAG